MAPPSQFGCSGAGLNLNLKPESAAGPMYLGVGFRNVGGLVISNVQGQAARPAASAPPGPGSGPRRQSSTGSEQASYRPGLAQHRPVAAAVTDQRPLFASAAGPHHYASSSEGPCYPGPQLSAERPALAEPLVTVRTLSTAKRHIRRRHVS